MRNHIIKNHFVPIFIICVVSIAVTTCAFFENAFATDRFNVLTFKPVTDGGLMFTVSESKTLLQWQWNVGAAANYAYKPLSAVQSGVNIDIVKRYLAQYFYGSLGFADWLLFSASMPIAWYEDFTNPNIPAARSANELGFGDMDVSLKFRILNRDKFPAGLAVVPFVSFPAGADDYFLGDDGFTGGGKLIFDSVIAKRVTLAVNAGAMARKHFKAYGLDFQGQFLASGGINVRATDLISVTGEVETCTAFDDLFGSKRTTPTEGRAGLQWRFGKDRTIALNTGAGFGLVYGAGAPRYSFFASISYLSPPKKKERQALADEFKAAKKARDEVISKVQKPVYFKSQSIRFTDEAALVLSQTADLLRENEWIKRISVEGYADKTGGKECNKELALWRAEAVKKFLEYHGVNPDRMNVVSFGDIKPVSTGKTRADLAKNRRVEIHVEM